MSLIAQIKQAQLTARKNRDTIRAAVLTTLIGEAEAVGKTTANRAPTDAEVVAVIKKFLKNISVTVDALLQSTPTLDVERATLEQFLPQQLTEEELRNVLSNLIVVHGVDSERKIGTVMRELKQQYEGRYSGQLANTLAKQIVGS